MADIAPRKPRGRQPISRHPLFPAMIALWSAALSGLAGLVLAAPLGSPVRMLLALGAAIVGGLAGFIAARRSTRPDATPAVPAAKVVMTARESGLWSELRNHRQALAAPEAPDGLVPQQEAVPEPEPEEEAPVAQEWHSESELEPAPLPETAAQKAPLPEAQPLPEPAPYTPPPPPPPPTSAAERIAKADLADLSPVELLERLALSLQRRSGSRPSAAPPMPGEEGKAPAAPAEELSLAYAAPAGHPLPTPDSRPIPADAEQALRNALMELQRMSRTS